MKKHFLCKDQLFLFKLLKYLLIIAIIWMIFSLFLTFGIFSFLKKILLSLVPFFLGLFFAFLLEPIVLFFEKKLPRFFSVFLSFFLFLSSLLLSFFLIIPPLLKESRFLFTNFPKMISQMKVFLSKLWPISSLPFFQEKINSFLNQLPMQISSFKNTVFPSFCQNCFQIGVLLFFSFLIGFYILYDLETIKSWIRKVCPKKYRRETFMMLSSLKKDFRHYLLGLFCILFLVFLTQLIGFSLIGMKSPIFFASLCAITDLIPYIGPYLGGIPCILVGFSISPLTGFLTIGTILVVQFLENSFYQPYILGKTVFLPPWLILTSIVVANFFFGAFGMILATPLLLILKDLFPFLLTVFKKDDFKKKNLNL